MTTTRPMDMEVLPDGWRAAAIGYLARIDYGHPFKSENFTVDETDVPVVRIRDVVRNRVRTYATDEQPYPGAWVCDGDIVIGMDGDFNHARWSGGRAALNQRVCVLRPGSEVDSRFLGYAVGRPLAYINETTHYTTVKHLSMEDLRAQRIPVPSLEVQRRVADMLDAETARIDTLTAKNQDLVRLNGIRRRTLVEEATKPRDGGCTVPLRFLLWEVDERVGTADTELPLLSVSISSGVGRRSTDSKGQVASDDLSNYKICRSGDIVLNRMRAFQGALGVADEDGAVSSDYAVLRPQRGLPRYFHHIMRAPWFVGEMTRRLRGIGDPTSANVRTPRINVTHLGLIEVPLPGRQEQHGVVSALDREFAIQERLTDAVGRQTAALKLKRQALITAAVTGQITL